MTEAEIIPIKGAIDDIGLGNFLRLELDRLDMDQTALAEVLGVSRQTINNLINGRQSMSTGMARRLAQMTGRTVEFWLRSRFSSIDLHPAITSLRPSVLVDWQIEKLIESREIAIDPFHEDRIQPASIDVTVSHEIQVDGRVVDVSERAYALEPGRSAGIQSLETVTLGLGIVGLFSGMGSLAKRGLLYGSGLQIDPGYSGALVFFVHNVGPTAFMLRAEMPIATVAFHSLAETPQRTFDRGDQRIFARSRRRENDAAADLRDQLLAQLEAHIRVTKSTVNDETFVVFDAGTAEFVSDGVAASLKAQGLAEQLSVLLRRAGANRDDMQSRRLARAQQLIGDLAVQGDHLLRCAQLMGFDRKETDDPDVLRFKGQSVPFPELGRRDRKVSLRMIASSSDRSPIELFAAIWQAK